MVNISEKHIDQQQKHMCLIRSWVYTPAYEGPLIRGYKGPLTQGYDKDVTVLPTAVALPDSAL